MIKSLIFLLLLYVAVGSGYSTAQTNLCNSSPDISKQKLNGFPAKKDVLAHSAIFSVFSAIAYEDNGLGMYKLPDGWKRHKSVSDETGLFIATFRNEDERLNVIAYRGTEFSEFSDWEQNLHRTQPQSEPALNFTQELIVNKQGWENILTGHSLGGGLAIEVSHKLNNVSVVVFNPSPRIGSVRNGNKNKRIVVREKHEPLAVFRRNPSARVDWELTYEALVDFTPGFFGQLLRKQHSIDGMALNLLSLTSNWSSESKLLYESICNDGN